MDLSLYFKAVPESLADQEADPLSFNKSIYLNKGRLSGLEGYDLAIYSVGVAEKDPKYPNRIRSYLYGLKKGSGSYKIIDLGELSSGEDAEETLGRIREVNAWLIEHDTLPILIGGGHDLNLGQYAAYTNLEKLVNALVIDESVDIEESESDEGNHIQKMMLMEPNFLFHYSHLAYQSFLVPSSTLETFQKLQFDMVRLGVARQRLIDMEPIIRDADFLSFDLCAIQHQNAPGTNSRSPFGLSGEEACQICWYAGMNEKLSSAGFYGYVPEKDDDFHTTARVAATMIWYFIEGYYHRADTHQFTGNDYLKYTVSLKGVGIHADEVIFYKSKKTDKWWMEVPFSLAARKYSRNSIVPCGYSDYQTAQSGEIPDRWLQTMNKLEG